MANEILGRNDEVLQFSLTEYLQQQPSQTSSPAHYFYFFPNFFTHHRSLAPSAAPVIKLRLQSLTPFLSRYVTA